MIVPGASSASAILGQSVTLAWFVALRAQGAMPLLALGFDQGATSRAVYAFVTLASISAMIRLLETTQVARWRDLIASPIPLLSGLATPVLLPLAAACAWAALLDAPVTFTDLDVLLAVTMIAYLLASASIILAAVHSRKGIKLSHIHSVAAVLLGGSIPSYAATRAAVGAGTTAIVAGLLPIALGAVACGVVAIDTSRGLRTRVAAAVGALLSAGTLAWIAAS